MTASEDVTIIQQDSVLSSLEKILSVLTAALAAIAAISLAVAGIGIMNVMLVSVSGAHARRSGCCARSARSATRSSRCSSSKRHCCRARAARSASSPVTVWRRVSGRSGRPFPRTHRPGPSCWRVARRARRRSRVRRRAGASRGRPRSRRWRSGVDAREDDRPGTPRRRLDPRPSPALVPDDARHPDRDRVGDPAHVDRGRDASLRVRPVHPVRHEHHRDQPRARRRRAACPARSAPRCAS